MRQYRVYECKVHPVSWVMQPLEEIVKPRDDIIVTDKSPYDEGWILTSDGWACKWCKENNPRVLRGLEE